MAPLEKPALEALPPPFPAPEPLGAEKPALAASSGHPLALPPPLAAIRSWPRGVVRKFPPNLATPIFWLEKGRYCFTHKHRGTQVGSVCVQAQVTNFEHLLS